MSITGFALAKSHFTATLTLVLFVTGLMLYLGFPSQEDPEFTIREAVVTTAYPGMAPERVENLLTRPVEEQIRKIPEVAHITSSSKTGLSIVHVTLHDRYFDLEPIWQDLRAKVDDLRPRLPDGTYGPFVNDEFGRVAIASIAITGDGFSLAELRDVAESLRDAIYTIPGTNRVDIFGAQDERIYLEVNDARLSHFGLTPTQVFTPLAQQNVILPGGRVEVQGRDYVFEPTGNFLRVEEIGEVPIALPTGGSVQLQDLVRVERRFVSPPEKPVFYGGRPGLVAAVSMAPGENIIAYGESLAARLHDFEKTLPIGYTLSLPTFQPALVERSIGEFASNLYQTIGVVLAVVLLFLGIRTGLIVGLIVPLTILTSLIFMRLLEIPLQRVSVAALIISLGLLVDNGIVMAEEIRTRIQSGVSRREAAIGAGQELAMPLLSSSLTTVLAFLPLMLADHYSGEYTRSLSQVIAIALLCSWFLALFVTPVFCFWFAKVESGGEERGRRLYDGPFYERYRGFLAWVLRRRLVFLGLLLVALVGSIWLLRLVPRQFFPNSERPQFLIHFELSAGTNAAKTASEILRMGAWLGDRESNPEIVDHVAYVGDGGPRFVLSFGPPDPGSQRALVLVNVRDPSELSSVMMRVRRHLLQRFPEVRARVVKLGLTPDDPGLVKIRVVGADRERLRRLARRVEEVFYSISGARDVSHDWGSRSAKVVVRIDQARARRGNVTSEDVARALSAAFDGLEVSQFREDDDSIPIMIRLAEAERQLDAMRTLDIYPEVGRGSVPLVQIAYFDLVFEDGNIRRRDLERTVTVIGRHPSLKASQLAARLEPLLAEIERPPGYRFEWGGELESSKDANAALFSHVPICFAGIVLLLVWQFNSVRRPLVILLTIPLSLIGAIVGLWVSGAPFGFMPVLGLLSLAGIIVNNAIVLIDRIDLEIAEGAGPYDAIVSASVKRLRPIVMTTLTTILGLIPLMLFGGELWFGMTVVIASGLGLGTVLTLGVIPVLYSLFFGARAPASA